MKNQPIESASLAFQSGTSDKVYFLNLEQEGESYTVTAQYGRRGGALATDNKTKNGSVPFDDAKKIFDRVLREKTAKGYRPFGQAAPASQVPPPTGADLDIKPPELLEEITDALSALVVSPAYLMQDKSDGHSRGALKLGKDRIFGINKNAQPVPLPAEIVASLSRIPLRTFQIDAELVGNKLVCRDLLVADGDISALPYERRLERLAEILPVDLDFVCVVETWDGVKEKSAALVRQNEERREGVVFKLKSAPYRAGRNGQHKKYKFVKTLSAIAGKPRATGKDSVEIFLLDATSRCRVANVSLIGKPQVNEGDVIEVAYLYAFPSKMLCQARIVRVRADVTADECTTAQLIYKREEAA